MERFRRSKSIIAVHILILAGLILTAVAGSRAATVFSENAAMGSRKIIIIDAGHGGIDGGATSCTGVLESQINLEIAIRLDDLMHLLGFQTKMIRTDDRSIHTKGETIAAKKVSDLKERVRIVNETDDAVLVSIHQNYFSDSRYSGAQVFYSDVTGSKELATQLQTELVGILNPGSRRLAKKADGVYLMEHIQNCGVLIECGFLSNPEEESLLRSEAYQKKLCCVIAGVLSGYLQDNADFT